MKQLGYFGSYNKLIRLYYLIISDWDNLLIVAVFKISSKNNTKYTIFVATNVYNMGINNSDIKIVI